MKDKFIDLLHPESEPSRYFTLIDQQLKSARIPAESALRYADIWSQINIPLAKGIAMTGNRIRKLKNDSVYGTSELLGLNLGSEQNPGVSLTFTVSDKLDGSYGLYNTKVKIVPNTVFNPFEYYTSIMYLLRRVSLPETKLTLYVRQTESRMLLEAGGRAQDTPLMSVFAQAGWSFYRYDRLSQIHGTETSELKRHRLVVINPGE